MKLALAIALSSIALLAGAQTPYVVGRNVQITHADSGRGVQEAYVCADPRDGRHIIAAAIVERGDTAANAFFVSFDAGATWRETLAVERSVDPSCAIGQDGIAFAASVHDSMPGDVSYLNVRRSLDGGRTWVESTIRESMRSLDRPYVTAGKDGRVWVHAYLQAPLAEGGTRGPTAAVLYASRDSGRTFERVALLPGTAFKTPWFFPANGVTLNDGTFIGLLVELDNTQRNMFRGRSDSASAPHGVDGELRVIRSTSIGRSVETSHIADVYYDWRTPQLSMSSLAVDGTSGRFRGRLYAVWPDARYGRRTQILLSHSDDAGRTWISPRVVSDGPDSSSFGPNDFMPMVAVNRDGVVGVSWYDRRDNPDNLGYWPRFRASLDGGATWLASTRVSSEPNRLTSSDRHLNGGDTAGLAADADGRFHLVWIDNRTGVAQAWAATVDVRSISPAR
jgi:hypothetical protein